MKLFNVITMVFALMLFTCTAFSASLHWEVASDGGTPDGYKIFYWQGEGLEPVLPDKPWIILAGPDARTQDLAPLNLNPGATYTFMLRAYNAKGESLPSNTVAYTTMIYTPEENIKPVTITIPGKVNQLIINFEN